MSASVCERAIAAALLLACGCGDPAAYRFGENLSGRLFDPIDLREGIHPSRSVLLDPANPFPFNAPYLTAQPDGGVGTKWQLLGSVGGVPAFYAFATALTQEPTGENQYYTAQMLGEIARTGAVAEGVDPEVVRGMAIAGYQSVLDNFPASVSFFADGVRFFALDVLAYREAAALGGTITGWILVTGPDGGVAVARTNQYTNPADGGH